MVTFLPSAWQKGITPLGSLTSAPQAQLPVLQDTAWLHRTQWAVPKVSLDSYIPAGTHCLDKATVSQPACPTHCWYVLVQFLGGLSRTDTGGSCPGLPQPLSDTEQGSTGQKASQAKREEVTPKGKPGLESKQAWS